LINSVDRSSREHSTSRLDYVRADCSVADAYLAPAGEVFERGARLRLLAGLLIDSELGEKAFPKPTARL